jgi:UDP-N-acetylglucosamine 2-epimerase (non-hydrolysing)
VSRPKLAFVLGIRPDVIRAALILEHLRESGDIDVTFIWSGQHYSDNLKDIFFRELGVKPADVELGCRGETDAEVVAAMVSGLYDALVTLRPDACVFLGDTNTTTGALACAQLNIPVVHIEGCMRSYDWRMPEEKYRTTIDHLSDLIYAYLPEYKEQGVREGLNPDRIVVVGNPIVDILQRFYFQQKARYDAMADAAFFAARGLARGDYYVMTCHRRENVGDAGPLGAVLALAGAAGRPVYFPASYRTQREIANHALVVPANVRMVDPIGYEEILALLVNSRGTLTDSGTVVEEACVLQVPCVQMRRATERPQVYDVGAAVKFDPSEPEAYPVTRVIAKLEGLHGTSWAQPFGDGRTSERIATDLRERLLGGGIAGHRPEQYHVPIAHSYRGDGLA